MNFDPFQTVEVPFDKDGRITPLGGIDGTGAQAAIDAMLPNVDDVIVISHGWNNDIDDARRLYTGFFGSLAAAWSAAGLTPADLARTGVVALYWPSKRFDESDLIPGGAAAIDDPTDYGAVIATQVANLKDQFGQFDDGQKQLLDTALQQVPTLDSEAAQNAFVAALAGLLPKTTSEADQGLDTSTSDLSGGDGSGNSPKHCDAAGSAKRCAGRCRRSGGSCILQSYRRPAKSREYASKSNDVLRHERTGWNDRPKRCGAARCRHAAGETGSSRAFGRT